MKKMLLLCALSCAAALFGAKAVPSRITLQGGNLSATLRANAGGCPVEVTWKGQPVISGTVGLTISYAEADAGFLGASRKYGKFAEEPVSLKVKVDGEETEWQGIPKLEGKVIECEKVSRLRDLTVTYRLRLENDKMSEEVSYSPVKDITLQRIYFYHPWNKRFTEFASRSPKGKEYNMQLTHNKKYVMSDDSIVLAVADTKAGIAAVASYAPGVTPQSPLRFLKDDWDAPQETLVECTQPTLFKAGSVTTFRSVTDFVSAKSAAEAVAASLKTKNK